MVERGRKALPRDSFRAGRNRRRVAEHESLFGADAANHLQGALKEQEYLMDMVKAASRRRKFKADGKWSKRLIPIVAAISGVMVLALLLKTWLT